MINIISATDRGLVRKDNQDYFVYHIYEDKNMAFAIVCDGMGGHNAGDVASRIACETIKQQLLRADLRAINPIGIKNVLESALSVANAMIFELSKEKESLSGMGTTVTAVFIIDNQVFIMYAGDSRAYLINNMNCTQLTKDHTIAQFLIDSGKIPQSNKSKNSNKITKALGVSPELDVDYIEYKLPMNGSILICTDGLSNYMKSENVLSLTNEALQTNNAGVFIDFALTEGGADNISAVLVSWRAE